MKFKKIWVMLALCLASCVFTPSVFEVKAMPHSDSKKVSTFEDKTLTCVECGTTFVFSAGEQKFFAEKGFESEPKKCQLCRNARKYRRLEELRHAQEPISSHDRELIARERRKYDQLQHQRVVFEKRRKEHKLAEREQEAREAIEFRRRQKAKW